MDCWSAMATALFIGLHSFRHVLQLKGDRPQKIRCA
jgi:hypothetical protein